MVYLIFICIVVLVASIIWLLLTKKNKKTPGLLILASFIAMVTFSTIEKNTRTSEQSSTPETSSTYTTKSTHKVSPSITKSRGTSSSSEIDSSSDSSSEINSSSEDKASDITKLSKDPSADQKEILGALADQQFNQQFPYKGSKIHSVLGVLQNWTEDDGKWYYKAEATIVNEYGAEQKEVVEIYITPETPNSGLVQILNY